MKNERLYKRLYYLWHELLALVDMRVMTSMRLKYDNQNLKNHKTIFGNITYEGYDIDFGVTMINDVDVWFHGFDKPLDFNILVKEDGEYDLDAEKLSTDITAKDIDGFIAAIEEKVKSYNVDLSKACENMNKHDRFARELYQELANI